MIAVVVAVSVLPLVWVWTAGRVESSFSWALARTVGQAVQAADEGSRPFDAIAEQYQVHLRIYGADGALLVDVDHTPRNRLLAAVSDPFYGPAGRPVLADLDARWPPVLERPEVRQATGVRRSVCQVADSGRMLVCNGVLRTADGRLVHAMRASPRLLRSLYEDRFQLGALTMVVTTVGVLLALWLGWRMVGPVERLRDQVVARTRGPVSTLPIVVEHRDEIGELASAFNQLLEALDDRNRANTTFAADLAHELKNPVAAIRAASEALCADRPVEGERLVRLQRVLADASRRMEVVVHQFLELARAESGLPGAEREDVDLHAMVGHLAEAARGDQRWAAVEIAAHGEPARVRAVPERLETAVRNLLANACTHAVRRVTLEVRECGPEVVLVVEDDGPGIPAGDLPGLFTRYHTTREGGTGLGLPMTKAIVEAHGGFVDAASEPGHGARFRITLPRAG